MAYKAPPNDYTFWKPDYSDWQCHIGKDSIVIRPLKGNEPNWFWRKMQYLVLGFEWKKVK